MGGAILPNNTPASPPPSPSRKCSFPDVINSVSQSSQSWLWCRDRGWRVGRGREGESEGERLDSGELEEGATVYKNRKWFWVTIILGYNYKQVEDIAHVLLRDKKNSHFPPPFETIFYPLHCKNNLQTLKNISLIKKQRMYINWDAYCYQNNSNSGRSLGRGEGRGGSALLISFKGSLTRDF